jgi:hypothetical protein
MMPIPLEWARFLCKNILCTACKWPTYLLRMLLNASAGLFVLLLNVLLMYLSGPSISHERCCQSLRMGHDLVENMLSMASNCPTSFWRTLIKYPVDGFEWAQSDVHSMLLNGPNVSDERYCLYLWNGPEFRIIYCLQNVNGPNTS